MPQPIKKKRIEKQIPKIPDINVPKVVVPCVMTAVRLLIIISSIDATIRNSEYKTIAIEKTHLQQKICLGLVL